MPGIIIILAAFVVAVIGLITGNRAKPGQRSLAGLSSLGAFLVFVSSVGMAFGVWREVQSGRKDAEEARRWADLARSNDAQLARSDRVIRELEKTDAFLRDLQRANIREQIDKIPAQPPAPSEATGIRGVVSDRDGRPVAGARVLAFAGPRVVGAATTDATGAYRLEVKSDVAVRVLYEHAGSATVVTNGLAPRRQHVIDQTLYPLPSPAGTAGDFAGRWDVYLGGKLVRGVELGAPKGNTGDYAEGAGTPARADYYEVEDGGRRLSLFKTGGRLVERGLVSWDGGDRFTYKIGDDAYEFRRRN